MYQPTIKFAKSKPTTHSYGTSSNERYELEDVEVEKAEVPFNVGRAWDAWAGVGLDKGHRVTTFEDALLRHRMIEAIYMSAKKLTKENYL